MTPHHHPAAHQLVGGRYELGEHIGVGRIAVTYHARDTVLDRTVALKLLRADYAADPHFCRRFSREAWLASPLSHANIVDLLDFGEHEGTLFIALQYVPGSTMRQVLARQGIPTPVAAVAVMQQVLRGLGAIHAAGIIHRDVKPENILMGADGVVRVADFGIAQRDVDEGLTSHGETWGTAAYMSPEQAQGRELTATSDLYAAGVILYELLTGQLPFAGDTAVAHMLAHVSETPVAPRWRAPERDIPSALEQVVMQALAKEPVERFGDAAAMGAALDEALSGARVQPVSGPTAGSNPVVNRAALPNPLWRRRRWARAALAGGVAVALVGGGATAWTLNNDPFWLDPISEVQAEPKESPFDAALPNLLLTRGVSVATQGVTTAATAADAAKPPIARQAEPDDPAPPLITRVTPDASDSPALIRREGGSPGFVSNSNSEPASVPGSAPSTPTGANTTETETETVTETETATETESATETDAVTDSDSGTVDNGVTPPTDTEPRTDQEPVPPSTDPDTGGGSSGGSEGGSDGGTSGGTDGGGGAPGETDWNSEDGSSGGEQSSEPVTDSGVDAAGEPVAAPTAPA